MPATDYLMPDGLRWEELGELLDALCAAPALAGLSLGCLNPEKDPGGAYVRRTCALLERALIDAEIPLLVVITEGIPVQDSAYAWAYNLEKGEKTRIIGPNCPGIITPGEALAGITPANISGPGPVGLVSKSGTLTYQMMYELRDFGFSTSIGIGGDPVIGTTHIDAIEAFEKDPETKIIVMIGEIGGDAEERAADYIKANVSKPVVGYVAGFTAPEGKTMGHAGAIVSGSSGTAARPRRRPWRPPASRSARRRRRPPRWPGRSCKSL